MLLNGGWGRGRFGLGFVLEVFVRRLDFYDVRGIPVLLLLSFISDCTYRGFFGVYRSKL